jgi:ribosome-binding protein aMBF1 (putative translation factor)
MAKQKSAGVGTLTLGGVEYVVIPKTEYLLVRDSRGLPAGAVDAHLFVRQSIGTDLRAAREVAGLTQAALAERMGKSQTMISQAESGSARVSERYVRAVLKACRLPADWSGSANSRPRGRRAARG